MREKKNTTTRNLITKVTVDTLAPTKNYDPPRFRFHACTVHALSHTHTHAYVYVNSNTCVREFGNESNTHITHMYDECTASCAEHTHSHVTTGRPKNNRTRTHT